MVERRDLGTRPLGEGGCKTALERKGRCRDSEVRPLSNHNRACGHIQNLIAVSPSSPSTSPKDITQRPSVDLGITGQHTYEKKIILNSLSYFIDLNFIAMN